MIDRMAIFIVSHNGSRDVLDLTLPILKKYLDDRFDIYIGCNCAPNLPDSSLERFIEAENSNWKLETAEQLEKLKEYGYSKVFLCLDDFLFTRFDKDFLFDLYQLSQEKEIDYLTLRRPALSIFSLFRSKLKKTKVHAIESSYAYYSSLQCSIWNIEHLIHMVSLSKDIWHFEKLKSNKKHFWIDQKKIRYFHIVEKGLWDSKRIAAIQKWYPDFDFSKRGVFRNSVVLFKLRRLFRFFTGVYDK